MSADYHETYVHDSRPNICIQLTFEHTVRNVVSLELVAEIATR